MVGQIVVEAWMVKVVVRVESAGQLSTVEAHLIIVETLVACMVKVVN